jgi:hypothetical protein
MLTIDLPEETESLLKAHAKKEGVDVASYAKKLLQNAVQRIATDPTIALIEKWNREDATDDPEEIARRDRELKEFMEGMNRNRLEMEGPDARLIYPCSETLGERPATRETDR